MTPNSSDIAVTVFHAAYQRYTLTLQLNGADIAWPSAVQKVLLKAVRHKRVALSSLSVTMAVNLLMSQEAQCAQCTALAVALVPQHTGSTAKIIATAAAGTVRYKALLASGMQQLLGQRVAGPPYVSTCY